MEPNKTRTILPQIKQKLRYLPIVMIIFAGILISFFSFIVLVKGDDQKIRVDFQRSAEDRYSALEREIRANLQVLLSLQALYTSSQDIKRSHFRDFVNPLLAQHSDIQALEWIPRVTNSQREPYEAAAKEDGFPDFQISERETQGKMVKAAQREEYFPVYYVEPYKRNKVALGFDLASNPIRKEALDQSRDAGVVIATSRIKLVQETGAQFGFLVFAPIYRKGAPIDSIPERRGNLRGFVLGVFRIGDILERSLTYLSPEGIHISLYDKSAPKDERFLYAHAPRQHGTTTLPTSPQETVPVTRLEYAKTLDLAARTWEVRFTATPDYIPVKKSWLPWVVLSAGLLFTALLAGYSIINFNRTRRIERIVKERTKELHEINETLAGEISVRKQAEEKLQKAHDALDARVRERTAELLDANEQLRQEITERMGAEEALREALKRAAWLARFPEENPSPVVRVSAEGSVLYRNRAAAEMPGWACEVGKPLPDPLLALVGLNITQGQETQLDVELGGRFYSVAITPFLEEGYANIYGRDITERRDAEAALRESEKRYRQVIEDAAEVIYTTDAKGYFTYGNSAGLKITGYSLEELQRLNYLDLVVPEHRQKLTDNYVGQVRERRSTSYIEFPFLSKSGRVIWFGQNASLVIQDGQVAGFHIIARDITERKVAEAALREQKQLLDNILNSIPTPVFYKDTKGAYLGGNSAYLDFMGLPRERVIGKTIAEFAPAELVEIYLKADQDLIQKGGSQVYEALFPHTDRSVREVMIHKALFRNVDGAISGIVGVIFDISERQRAEEALRKSEKEARRLAEENAIMAEIGRIINSSLRIEEVYKLFSEEVKKLLSFDRITINLIEANKGIVINQYTEGISTPGRLRGKPFPMEGTMTEAVIKKGKGLILDIQDEKEIELKFPGLLPEAQVGLRSFLSVPLISGDRATGALHLRSRECKAYSEGDLRLAENIAHQITGPITNAQLFDDLKSTAEALRRSEILLRNVLDLLPVGVGIADKNGKITSINPAREQIWEGAKIVGIEQYKEFKGWWRDTGEKIEAEEWPLARAVINGEISIEKEIDIKCFNGARKTVLNWAVPIRDPNQGIIGAIAVNQDITERKQAEERLRHSEEHFRSLIENSSDMIIEVDKNGVIFYISPSAERILGYKANSLIGKNAFEFMHPDDLTRTREAFGYLYQNPGITKAIEYRLRHSDGSWRIFQSFRKVVSEDGGNPVMVINSRDITEQKNLESQLVQAQKLESIGQLAAGIAHEINTPTQYVGDNTRFFNDAFKDLNRLLGKYDQLFQTIKNGAPLDGILQEIEGIVKEIDLAYLTDEIPKAIRQTLEGVERVRIIVQAMKEFSHPGTKEKTPINLNKAIQNTITVARNEWKYVAEMATDFDPSLPLVSGLPGELNQVILNMIINAAHAIADVVGDGSKGKGTITVRTRQDGNWAEIRVSDTGTGIPENIRSRVFDPFFTTKEVGKGTGQGLTIARSVIVDKHGGTIDFETEVDKGTNFIIRLPLDGEVPKKG